MNCLIKFENVTKTYVHKFSKHRIFALNSVSFSVKKGEICALVGESGAGKTTTAKLLTGVEKPDKGSIYYNDKNILNLNKSEFKQILTKIHYLHQNSYSAFNPVKLLGQSVYEPFLILGGSKEKARSKIKSIFKMLNLDMKLANKKPSQVSGGELQRIAIARALTVKPETMIFDEPFASVDDENKEQILKILFVLQARGITVILISHNLQMVNKVANSVVVLNKGEIAEKITF
jgi:ABC-type glutathione transport system ATPase component